MYNAFFFCFFFSIFFSCFFLSFFPIFPLVFSPLFCSLPFSPSLFSAFCSLFLVYFFILYLFINFSFLFSHCFSPLFSFVFVSSYFCPLLIFFTFFYYSLSLRAHITLLLACTSITLLPCSPHRTAQHSSPLHVLFFFVAFFSSIIFFSFPQRGRPFMYRIALVVITSTIHQGSLLRTFFCCSLFFPAERVIVQFCVWLSLYLASQRPTAFVFVFFSAARRLLQYQHSLQKPTAPTIQPTQQAAFCSVFFFFLAKPRQGKAGQAGFIFLVPELRAVH